MSGKRAPDGSASDYLKRICFRVWNEDMLKIKSLSASTGVNENEIVREILHNFVKGPKEKVERALLQLAAKEE